MMGPLKAAFHVLPAFDAVLLDLTFGGCGTDNGVFQNRLVHDFGYALKQKGRLVVAAGFFFGGKKRQGYECLNGSKAVGRGQLMAHEPPHVYGQCNVAPVFKLLQQVLQQALLGKIVLCSGMGEGQAAPEDFSTGLLSYK